jgi:hypothetical protein
MKLYNVPRNTYVRVNEETGAPPGALPCDQGTVVHFCHIDGMYSYCKDLNGNVIHLAAWTDVEPISEEEFNSYA